MRRRPGPTRLLGAAGLLFDAAVLAAAVPDLAGASRGVRAACSYTAVGLVCIAILLLIAYDLSSRRSPRPR
ncbi:hypothetical protein AB0I94_34550 [Streptomyces sp. NPDC050147]|uniref:hypothetical protein n=1 Tax=Streptomyces sp. NPDC050147 TaxID=3155513 RepID=UPI00341A5B76